jgi:hypothetical protein
LRALQWKADYSPRSWDDGLDGAALCHDLLWGCARFLCGAPRDADGVFVLLQFMDHAYCQRVICGPYASLVGVW